MRYSDAEADQIEAAFHNNLEMASIWNPALGTFLVVYTCIW